MATNNSPIKDKDLSPPLQGLEDSISDHDVVQFRCLANSIEPWSARRNLTERSSPSLYTTIIDQFVSTVTIL